MIRAVTAARLFMWHCVVCVLSLLHASGDIPRGWAHTFTKKGSFDDADNDEKARKGGWEVQRLLGSENILPQHCQKTKLNWAPTHFEPGKKK